MRQFDVYANPSKKTRGADSVDALKISHQPNRVYQASTR
jgi:hypothetical protein